MVAKVAPEAHPWYNNEVIEYGLPRRCCKHPRAWTNLIRRFVMDTIHPHGLFQQAFSFDETDSPQEQKTCKGPCGRTLPATTEHFYANSSAKSGLDSKCKECRKDNKNLAAPEGHKRCLGDCGRTLPATTKFFHRAKLGKYGLDSKCKECKSRRPQGLERKNLFIDHVAPEGHKRCTGPCNRTLPATTEYFHSAGKHGVHSQCKECTQAKKRKPPVISDIPEGYKKCSGLCGQTLPATTAFFGRNKTQKDGLTLVCKECRSKKQKSYDYNKLSESVTKRCTGPCGKEYPATPEYFTRFKHGKYGLQSCCKQCKNDARRKPPVVSDVPEGHRRCPQCKRILAATAEFFHRSRNNKDGLYGTCKECYNPQKRGSARAYQKIYRNRPENYERLKEWSVNRSRNRYVRNKGVSGKHTLEQIKNQLKRQKHKCYYCQKRFEKSKGKYIYHIEHTFPISRVAGTDIPANSIDYLVLACPACNFAKGNKFPWEFPEGGRLV